MSTRSRRRQPPPEEVPEDTEMGDAPTEQAEAATVEDAAEDTEMNAEQEATNEQEGEGAEGEEEEDDDDDDDDEVQKVRLLPGSTETAASFEFLEEGHTLGNALRYIIMKNPNVEFCGYAIPHPAEAKMNVRIQTYEGSAIEALEKGLRDLQDLCDVVTDKYWDARNKFVAAQS